MQCGDSWVSCIRACGFYILSQRQNNCGKTSKNVREEEFQLCDQKFPSFLVASCSMICWPEPSQVTSVSPFPTAANPGMAADPGHGWITRLGSQRPIGGIR